MSTPVRRIIGTRRIDCWPRLRRHNSPCLVFSMKILAISGSLRAVSSNTAVLRAAVRLAPDGVEIVLFDGLSGLPFFNPDLDGDQLPAAVAAFRGLIGEADGILISSPEYARGVAGVLKNALDWLVASFEFPNKPVALINTSPRATHAQ